jgi:hypothetical protein
VSVLQNEELMHLFKIKEMAHAGLEHTKCKHWHQITALQLIQAMCLKVVMKIQMGVFLL